MAEARDQSAWLGLGLGLGVGLGVGVGVNSQGFSQYQLLLPDPLRNGCIHTPSQMVTD